MASSKDTFEANSFEANSFACGTFRGLGVTVSAAATPGGAYTRRDNGRGFTRRAPRAFGRTQTGRGFKGGRNP